MVIPDISMKDQKKSIESQKNVNHTVFFAIKKARINVLFWLQNEFS